MYTIKRAAELVGVSETTLRAWERRYGLGAATRTPSGYRLYDEQAISALATMRQLVDDGWAAREAAAETQRRNGHPPDVPRPAVSALTDRGDVDDLVARARTFDDAGLSLLLDQRFAQGSFEAVVDDWMLPALDALGRAWHNGEVSVAQEHFVSHGIVRRLAAAYDAAGGNHRGASTVLGLPPGVHHDLGLLAFATAARRAGIATRYLGANVPASSWAQAVALPQIRCAVLAAPRAADADDLREAVAAMRAVRPDLLVAVGGAHQDVAPAGCLTLGHRIGTAATTLAGALTAQTED